MDSRDTEQTISTEEDTTDWTVTLLDRRDGLDKEDRKDLGRVGRYEISKRIGDVQQGKRKKTRKFELVGEEWGLEEAKPINALLKWKPLLRLGVVQVL